jgi:hypothetical protein
MDDVLGCRKVTSGVMMAELPNPDQLERNYARPVSRNRDSTLAFSAALRSA